MAVVTFTDFHEARAVADEEDLSVGGCMTDAGPVYFLHSATASDPELAALAFEAEHGRPMNEAETQLYRLALESHPEKLEASL